MGCYKKQTIIKGKIMNDKKVIFQGYGILKEGFMLVCPSHLSALAQVTDDHETIHEVVVYKTSKIGAENEK